MKLNRLVIFAVLLSFAWDAEANITLPAIFSDHMVLKQESQVTVWGWAKPNEVVRITCSWDPGKEYEVKVDSHSYWSIDIETPSAGGRAQLTVPARLCNSASLTDSALQLLVSLPFRSLV